MKVDVLIVGQGLAGSCLSLELRRKGISFHVIDQGHENASSSVAAGLYNPIGFKRIAVSWNAEEVLKEMNALYNYAEEVSGIKVLCSKDVLKIFSAEADLALLAKSGDAIKPFSNGQISAAPDNVNAPFGVVQFSKTGFLKVKQFLSIVRELLIEEKRISCEEFSEADLEVSETVKYRHIEASRIIFCEGAFTHSSYWKHLPFKPVKGELLLVEIPGLQQDHVLIKDGFLIPLGEKKFIIGSTYVWNDLERKITDAGKEELIRKLKKFTDLPFTIISQAAGIRPASHDRKPYVGWNRDQPLVGILNGLGTKGVLMAPFCAVKLVNSLIDNTPVPAEIEVNRTGSR